ncbi:MAG: Crp/Fnr family transcriptional regulator [Eubacteriales bacterium]|nr:Crp/Fnr family transcriptional regulator [Eubacteriales bacterium]
MENTELFSKASPESRAKILAYAVIAKYKKGEYLFRMREKVSSVYILVSGYAVLERVNRNNDRRAIFLLGEGTMLNEIILQRPESSINCYAKTEVTVVKISREQFLEIMEGDFGFTRMVMDSMSDKIRRLYHQVENTTKMMKLDKQIASRIWKFSRDYGIEYPEYRELPFRMSITFLAELVGSNRETVSRIIRDFSDQGLLSIRNGVCRVYDMDGLTTKIWET